MIAWLAAVYRRGWMVEVSLTFCVFRELFELDLGLYPPCRFLIGILVFSFPYLAMILLVIFILILLFGLGCYKTIYLLYQIDYMNWHKTHVTLVYNLEDSSYYALLIHSWHLFLYEIKSPSLILFFSQNQLFRISLIFVCLVV